MSWLSNFLSGVSGGDNPADAAMPYLNQIPQMAKQYYEPYIGYGKEAYNVLGPQFKEQATNPTGVLEKILSAYQPSRAYQLSRDEVLRMAGNTAAAGGMRGSLGDIKNESRITDALLGQDMQQWLQNVMGLKTQGLSGLQPIFQTGFNASQGLESDLSNVLGTQSQLAFQGQREGNQRKSDLLSALLGMGSAGLGFGTSALNYLRPQRQNSYFI